MSEKLSTFDFKINKKMNFEAQESLGFITEKIRKRLLFNFIFLICVDIGYSIKLYSVDKKSFDLPYFIGELLLVIFTAVIYYYQVKKVKLVMNILAETVVIADDAILVKTFPFKLLFWDNKPCQLKFNIDELSIKKTANPLKFTFMIDNKVFIINDKQKKAYIVFDFFDKALEEKLTDILIKVTPSSQLIPGRLKHY